ncbi:MAG: AraC family transcriptional regulator [Bacteroidota bacterium]
MRITKYLRVLDNRNEIFYEKVTEASDQHVRSKFSIRVVFSGHETYVLGNRQINLYPGSFLVINEDTTYTRIIHSEVPVTSFSITYDPEFLDKFSKSLKSRRSGDVFLPYRTSESEDLILIDSMYTLTGDMEYNIMHLKNHADKGLTDQFMISQYLHHLLLNYCNIYNDQLYSKTSRLHENAKNGVRMDIIKRIAMAKDFIISNHEKNIKLEDISSVACLSVSHLIRIFRLIYNKSPYQYLIQVRLERAKYYLRNSGSSIQEIVNLVGFENPSSFIRSFRTTYSITPGAFRHASLN